MKKNDECGRFLKKGRGLWEMLEVCNTYGYTADNTILIVDDDSDLESTWSIYEKVEVTE